jgi:hypothetical protein
VVLPPPVVANAAGQYHQRLVHSSCQAILVQLISTTQCLAASAAAAAAAAARLHGMSSCVAHHTSVKLARV